MWLLKLFLKRPGSASCIRLVRECSALKDQWKATVYPHVTVMHSCAA